MGMHLLALKKNFYDIILIVIIFNMFTVLKYFPTEV